ncbi:MAG: hypothetical protein J6J86_08560 [Lachnospiraceae bacterium]|nr:hypothetical protein [Lachnospiraceae bacterium]
MAKEIYHVYNEAFRTILTLSSAAVINLINGLYDTDYTLDSTIDYNWTEFDGEEYPHTLADTVITINHQYSYHVEARLQKDDNLVFRVFECGFYHANHRNQTLSEEDAFAFPQPRVIYLYAVEDIPDEYAVTLDAGKAESFQYSIPVIKYLNTSPEELTRRKIAILVPFQLLKLQEVMKKERSPENLEALKNLIQKDILGSIDTNLALGNITLSDAGKLKYLTYQLYKYLYAHYDEIKVPSDIMGEYEVLAGDENAKGK